MSQNSVAVVPSASLSPGMRSPGSEGHRGKSRKNGGLMMRMVGCFVPQSKGHICDSETVNRGDQVVIGGSSGADCAAMGVTTLGHTTTTVHGNGNVESMRKSRVLSYSSRKRMSKKERLAEEARRKAEEEEARRDAEALALYLGKKSNHAAVKKNVVAEIGSMVLDSEGVQEATAHSDINDGKADGMVMKTPERMAPMQSLKVMMEKDVECESDDTKMSHQSNETFKEEDGVITFDEYGGVRKAMSMMSRNVSELELPAVGQEPGVMPRNGSTVNVLATPQRSEIMKSGRYNEDGTSDGSDGAYIDGADHDGNTTPMSSEDQSTVQRIFNKRILEPLPNSCFLDLAEHYEGEIMGRQIKSSVIQGGAMRRNVSWTGEISLSMFPRSKNEQHVNRRHTVLVLMNQDSDNDEENDDAAKEISFAGNIADDNVKRCHSVQRKLSQVYDTHHVHLKKLREQMGDSNTPPKDLLALMARKVFVSQAMLDDDDDLLDGINNSSDHSYTETTKSHDLEDCSSRLPRIKTKRRQPAPSCHL
eukprot:jgi/Picsp_1/656/NSC_00651-R1_---NA---